MKPRRIDPLVTVLFLATIASAPIVQIAVEARRGQWPQALELFRRIPTPDTLRAYERRLEDASWLARTLRPWMQYAQFALLTDAGEKALLGRDGWLFYKPGVQYLTCRQDAPEPAAPAADPLPAILAFRDALAARGIRLLLVPAPNKESIYPERLTRRAQRLPIALCDSTRALLQRLEAAGVETVNLFGTFGAAKHQAEAPLYLAHDTHWSPAGIDLAAKTVAQRILARGWVARGNVEYGERPLPVRRVGDLLRMLRVPPIERRAAPETIACAQVVRAGSGALYRDDPGADVLVLGDSFLRIFEHDEPRAAGLVAHLACELRRPLASLVSDGGASTLVRQELARRPALLAHKKILVWEFVERDIRFGAEGWQIVPLPPP